MKIPALILEQLLSKVIVDRTRIPREVYEKVEPLISEFRQWSRTLQDLDIDKPDTWVQSSLNVVESLVEKDARRVDPIDNFLHQKGFKSDVPDSMCWVGEFLMEELDLDVEIESSNKRLCKAPLENGGSVFITISGDEYEFDELHIPPSPEKNLAYEGIRDLFWSKNESVIIDSDVDEFIVMGHQFENKEYKGQLVGEVEGLKEYIKSGVRRVIIFQGVPGTGKSTLCANAHKILSKRTIVITNQVLTHISRQDWRELIDLLQPTLVIIDDIDRGNSRALETSLFLFEDSHYHVPVTLMSTNDQSRLPDAFRRPGRIDQIIKMPLPTEDIRRDIIVTMAEREGVEDIPEYMFEFFDRLIQAYPVSHLVELLRRYKVKGWDYTIPPNDIVFSGIEEEILKLQEEEEKEEEEDDSPSRSHEALDWGRSTCLEVIGPESCE